MSSTGVGDTTVEDGFTEFKMKIGLDEIDFLGLYIKGGHSLEKNGQTWTCHKHSLSSLKADRPDLEASPINN